MLFLRSLDLNAKHRNVAIRSSGLWEDRPVSEQFTKAGDLPHAVNALANYGNLQRELGETPLPDTEAIYRQALDSTMRRALERASEIEPERLPVLVAVGR